MFKSIKSKIIGFTIFFILLVIFFPSLFLASQFEENFKERSIFMLDITLDIVQKGLEKNMELGQHKDIQQTISDIGKNKAISHIRFIDNSGLIKYASDTTEISKNIFRINPTLKTVALNEGKTFQALPSKIYASWQPIMNGENCQECHDSGKYIGYIGVESHFTQAERFFYTGSQHIYFLAIAVIFILIAGYYMVLQYFLGKPFSRFINALGEVEKGNLNVSLPAQKNDEIGTLEKHFNRMTEQISTSKEQIEEMHNDQIQRADKLVTLGELAAEMAHEVNNPAGIIMSRADYIQLETDDNPQLMKFSKDIEVILKQTEKISNITGNILKYGKKRPKDFSNFKLSDILDESLFLLQPRTKKKKIKIVKDISDPDDMIFGDALQIDQVFTNLINNAVEAIGSDGTIKISVYKKEKKIYLVISDNGPGIEADVLGKIYAPFFTTKDPQIGTGIGLYVVRNILKNHNAEIECKSILGKGTEFTLIFNGLV